MTVADSWCDKIYFEATESDSLDGGVTSHGALWHSVSPRWGHAMHPMCSYQGMFPPKMVHYFIQKYTRPDDLVFDPFSGRGTTVLQARAEGRRTVGNDLNPLGYVLTKAKAAAPSWPSAMKYVDRLESRFARSGVGEPDVSDDIRMLFHPTTLRQVWFLREQLNPRRMRSWVPEQFMVAACIAGILHGSTRKDGSSAYLSLSMPNTFSMSPMYVKKYVEANNLAAPEQNVFARLREKIARQYLDAIDGPTGEVHNDDAARLMNLASLREQVDLLVTSPPYLHVVNYGTSNWIRLWWLGLDEVGRQTGTGRRYLDAELDHRHNYSGYRDFMRRIFYGTAKVLRPDGVAVFVIGDVATPDGVSLELAQKVWDDVGAGTGLRLVELIEDHLPLQNKVSRILGETRGRATERDCVLVLARADGPGRVPSGNVDWTEPYKDAGPDAAHAIVLGRRGQQA